ncbi:MAG TPA: HupE/UreJ family protein [Polyangiaceae bacterium]|nr:HupE/UreJ family protein [Polyangiaceae bacterium]
MRRTHAAVALAMCLVAFAVAVTAAAHTLGLSRGEYRLDGATVVGTFTFARTEMVIAVPALDRDGVALSDVTLGAEKDAIARAIVDRVAVTGDGARCPGKLDAAKLSGTDAVELTASFECPAHPNAVDIDFAVFDVLSSGHRHLAHASLDGASADWIASRGNSKRHLLVGRDAKGEPQKKTLPLFRMGIEHILSGYDHLLFLAGLVLVSVRVKPLLGAITAFTVAHSITLALAVLGVWAPSPRIVEPGIALSIAYVGVENLFLTDARGRWRITFPFGLLHGFGFAAALRELSMPKSELPMALLSFNLGVETGQLGVIAILFPVLLFARRRGVLTDRVVKVLSVGVATAGAVWFVSRVATLWA